MRGHEQAAKVAEALEMTEGGVTYRVGDEVRHAPTNKAGRIMSFRLTRVYLSVVVNITFKGGSTSAIWDMRQVAPV